MSMIKLIYSSAFDNTVDVGMRLVNDASQLTKSAGTIFGADYSDLRPEPGFVGIHLTALGDFEHFGCFFAGAPVQTPEGQRPIESIKVGDLVLTHKGNYKPVTHVFEEPYDGDRVAIEVTGLPDPIVSTSNHPFLVVRRDGLSPAARCKLRKEGRLADVLEQRVLESSWAAADSIRPGDYLVVPLELGEEYRGTLGSISSEYDPYVVGFYVAEGCLAKEYRDISTCGEYKKILLTGSKNDSATWDYIDSWLTRIGREPTARGEAYTSEEGVRYGFGFKQMADWLDYAFGHTAHTKHIHPIVWTWSKEDRIRFLAGYFDGDGCLQYGDDRYTGTLTCSSVSRSLVFDVMRLLASVGVPSSISKGYNRESNGCFGRGDLPVYSLSVGSCYSNTILAKSLRFKPHAREYTQYGASSMQLASTYALLRVDSIMVDSVESTMKYNLEVLDDNSYVVDVQGHNSNRNGDAFSKQACIKYHDTFVKHGHVYRHHRNKDPRKSLGSIKASAYNEPMGRIELFIHVDEKKAEDELSRLEKEGTISFSMACKVAHDRCSICNQLRKNAEDPAMCDHIRYDLGKKAEDGSNVFTFNDEPDFFDISFVGRPADRIAWDLKVASGETLDSVKLAEYEGVWVPDHIAIESAQGLRKMDHLQAMVGFQSKYIGWFTKQAAVTTGLDRYVFELRKAAGTAPSPASIEQLRNLEPKVAFAVLAKAGVILDPVSFFKYAMGPQYGSVAPYAERVSRVIPYVMDRLVKAGECHRICNDATFDVSVDNTNLRRVPCSLNEELSKQAMAGVNRDERMISVTGDNQVPSFAVDNTSGNCFNDLTTVALAEKYSAYKVAAVDAILEYHNDTDSDSVRAIAAAQNLVIH